MKKKSLYLLALLALLGASVPAWADAVPPAAACATELSGLAPDWMPLTCPQSFCLDDDHCRSICPSDPGATCNLSTGTCSYSGGSGPGGGSCSSGALCTPGRFCNDHDDCSSCLGGCSGYCAPDSVCRII